VVLRNTSDSFPDNVAVCLMRTGEAHYWNWLATNSFSDDGTKVMGQCANFIDGLPTICCTGGTDGAPITMWDIYQWALTGAPGRIFPALSTAFMDFEASGWKKDGMSWVVHANLAFGWNGTSDVETHFKNLYHGALIIYGGLWSRSTAYLTFGHKVNNDRDANGSDGPLVLVHQPATGGLGWNGATKAYNLRLQQGGRRWGGYAFSAWNNPYCMPGLELRPGSEILDCDFGYLGNGMSISAGSGGPYTVRRCRLAGIRGAPNVNLEKPHITWDEGLGFRTSDNCIVTEPLITYAAYDIMWRTALKQTVIDGAFQSRQQADNKPWLALGYGHNLNGWLKFQNTIKGSVSDQAGTPISGAAVTVKDKDGNTVYSGTTDINGKFDAGAVTARVLYPTAQINGVWSVAQAHEDTHIADGWLSRTMHTPHTLTIEKAGYETYVDVFNLVEKKDLDLALSPAPAPVYLAVPSGEFTIEAQTEANLEVALSSSQIEVTLR